MKKSKRVAVPWALAFVFVLVLGAALSWASPEAAPGSLNTGQHFLPPFGSPRERFGFDSGPLSGYDVTQLHAGWYSNWGSSITPPHPDQLNYVQLIRLHAGSDPHDPSQVRVTPSQSTIASIIAANPGSLWLIGNEPDSLYQGDPILPDVYPIVYHDLYTYIKELDPFALVANGGIVQPTPCRLEYLDIVWDTYLNTYSQTMPVDVWNIHAFILREVHGSWGASTPPGVDPSCGIDYGVNDADDMNIFRDNLRAMRGWMKEKGYQDTPLIISEYGILWPEWFAPQFDAVRVSRFMTQTFDLFLYESHPDVGYPADGHRLVQAWAWYSLDDDYYNGALFDVQDQTITAIGQAYATYTAALSDTDYVDLTAWLEAGLPDPMTTNSATLGITFTLPVTTYVGNLGKLASPDTLMRFELFSEQGHTVLYGRDEVHDVPARFDGVVPLSLFTVTLPVQGRHELCFTLDPDGQVDEPREWNNVITVPVDFRPDWAPISLTHRLAASSAQSGTLIITSTVRNQGNWSSPAMSATLSLGEVGQQGALSSTGWLTVTLPPLDIDAQANLVHSATVSTLGLFELSLAVDPANTVAELSETNNQITSTLDLRPDLRPVDLSYRLQGPAIQSGSLTLTATVVNQGGWASPAVSATACLAKVPSGTLALPKTMYLPTLTIGSQVSATISLTWPAPEHDLYRLVLEVDPAGQVPERDEGNNQTETVVPVSIKVSLSPTTTTVLTSAGGGLKLVFPTGLVTEALDIDLTPLWPPEWVTGSVKASQVGFSLSAWQGDAPAPFAPSQPIWVTWDYETGDLAGLDEARLRLFGLRDSGAWLDAACRPYQRDIEKERLMAGFCQLGSFVFGNTHLLYLPWVHKENGGATFSPVALGLWVPNTPLRLPGGIHDTP